MSMSISSTIQSKYNKMVYRQASRAYERALKARTNYDIANQVKERDNATIIVHGIAGTGWHMYGWSEEFAEELKSRAPNQDYYEFTWSGFKVQGGFGINMGSHNIAKSSLILAINAIKQKGYKNVNIISHSWGTVLSRDAQYEGGTSIHTWFTMGSPLPRTTSKPKNTAYWFNFWANEDPVLLFGPLLELTGADGGDGWLFQNTADVDKQYTVFGGHGAYWTDYSTLGIIGGQLDYQ